MFKRNEHLSIRDGSGRSFTYTKRTGVEAIFECLRQIADNGDKQRNSVISISDSADNIFSLPPKIKILMVDQNKYKEVGKN